MGGHPIPDSERLEGEVLANLPGRDGWHLFMSFEGGLPAGTGALCVRDGSGWLDSSVPRRPRFAGGAASRR